MRIRPYSFLQNLAAVAAILAHVCSNNAFAAKSEKKEISGLIYYDADETLVEGETKTVRLKGKVTILIGSAFIFADRAYYSTEKGFLSAYGNVKLYRPNEKIIAEKLNFKVSSAEYFISDAQIINDPAYTQNLFNEDALGFTAAELLFESERNKRIDELFLELKKIRHNFIANENRKRLANRAPQLPIEPKMIDDNYARKYAQILEKIKKIRFQENSELLKLDDFSRKTIEQRRAAVKNFLASNQSIVDQLKSFQAIPGYSNIKVKELYRNSKQEIDFTDLKITSCNCGDKGVPLWGFSGKQATMIPEQYVTLKGATLDLLTVPVLYSPYLKVPIKTKRQSGFLLPSFFGNRQGTATSIPFYLTLGDEADTTLGVTEFSTRGTRFESEARYQLTKHSLLTIKAESISDSSQEKYKQLAANSLQEWDAEQKKVDSKYPDFTEENKNKLNKIKKNRSYLSYALTVPVSYRLGLKSVGESTSDNRYLGDFEKDTSGAATFLTPNFSTKRFLNQETSAEYYGDFVSLSARIQNPNDLFATSHSETSVRAPKIEFNLFPLQVLSTPLIHQTKISWEKVQRIKGEPFLDRKNNDVVVTGPGGPQKIERPQNKRKDLDEFYAEGNRAAVVNSLTIPAPQNSFFDAKAGVSINNVLYEYPAVFPESRRKPLMTYNSFDAELNIPIYSMYDPNSTKTTSQFSTENSIIRTDILPSLKFTYIPEIFRSLDFPRTNQTFYEADNVTSKKTLQMGVTTSLLILRDNFERAATFSSPQMPGKDIPVANETYFEEALQKKSLTLAPLETSENDYSDSTLPYLDNAKSFEKLTSDGFADVWNDWARIELSHFKNKIDESNFGEIFHWVDPFSYKRNNKYTLNLLTFGISSEYNFDAQKTALEQNKLKDPQEAPILPENWGNIKMRLDWNLSPLVPISGAFYGEYRTLWERLEKGGFSLSVALPFKTTLNHGYDFDNPLVTLFPERKYLETTTQTTSAYFQPLNWLQFVYGKKLVIKDEPAARLTSGKEYEALQQINFLNLQDCMDLKFQRLKEMGKTEREAIWSVGLNLRFMGYNRDMGNIGDSLNQAVHRK